MKKNVSVIIPAFNAENTIEKTIHSVLNQTLQPLEIIVIDDGSTDGTASNVKSIAKKKKSVQYIYQRNEGPSAARNRGIASAKGEYIAFCDSDDAWHEEKLARQAVYLDQNPACAMIGSLIGTGSLNKESRIRTVTFNELLLKNRFVTSTVVMRRDVAASTGFNVNQRYSEDYRLWLTVAYSRDAALCEEPLVVYGGGKPGFGHSGLSSKLWEMEKGELSNYRFCFRQGFLSSSKISGSFIFGALCSWSIVKFVRRLLLSSLRKSAPAVNKKKTLLFVGNTSFSMYNFRIGVMRTLRDQGCRVVVAAPRDSYSELIEKEGITFVPIEMSRKGTNPLKELATVKALSSLYAKVQPDLIFNFTIKPIIYGSVAAAFRRRPSVAVTTGLGYAFIAGNRFSPAALIARMLYRVSLLFPEEVWFLNSEDRDIFVRRHIVNRKKTLVIPGEGVDTVHFAPKKKAASKKISFILIARIVADKGVREYVEAARILKTHKISAECCLLGSFDDYPNAITKTEVDAWEKEGVIRYLGITKDVRGAVSNSDCVVLPSAYREGVPRSLMEGAAMEKPLIATDIAGCRDLIKEGVNGFLCEPKNAQSLADAMEKFCSMTPAKRAAMGKRGRAFIIENFDERIIAEIYQEAIERVI